MINADVKTHNENLFFVRFSDPNEDFGNKPYFAVDSMAEVKRRLYVRNRVYIIETLTSWLKQRRHAMPHYHRQIDMYLDWLFKVKDTSFTHVCTFIELRKASFESVAPSEDSKFYNHYINFIVPILKFCCEKHD